MGLDVGRAISFIFRDPDWVGKTLIGGLLLLIPIIGWLIVAGYLLRIMRRVHAGDEQPLPAWDDFGGDFVLGFKSFVAALGWFLPVFAALIILVPSGIAMGSSGSSIVRFLALIVFSAVMAVVVLYSFAYTLVLPLILSRVAVTDRLGPAFEVRAVLREMRAVPVPLVVLIIFELGLRWVAGFGVVLFVVGLLFTSFLAYAMLSHAYGQLRRLLDEPARQPAIATSEA